MKVNCLAVNCHQCRRSDRRTVVPCTKCKEKFYRIKCIREWYPELEEEEVSELCPYCHGKCNCNLCLHSSGMLKGYLHLQLKLNDHFVTMMSEFTATTAQLQ
ncbi:lysine-specific demethylase JMJ25-like isoform X6 [Capsicum annuum]|uniref:lysine-specific demethylase JMJ25-like isoform X6 n=1 Tax=Capsicum annuum TaxID=4072 RepID=UPI001FB0F523|nr:lysine-specific demethylase JMJ25-like isoform X6 [Capsicum annuum]